MAKPSLNPDKAKQGGGGIEAGNYLVEDAKFANIKTDFRPNQMYLVLNMQTCDKDGDPVRGADPVEMHVSFGEKSLEAFHPGQGGSPEDPEPEDQGEGPDAAGNTVYCSGDEQFNKSCGAIVFMESLAKLGFPKATLDRCWAPDFVGLKFSLATLPPKECNDRLGTRLNTKPMKDRKTGEDVAITYKVADKWLNPNYLSNTNGAKTAKGKGAAAAETRTDQSIEEIAAEVLAAVAAQKPGEKNKIKTHQQLVGFSIQAYTKAKKDPKKLAAFQKLVKDENWLIGALAEIGAVYEDGVTTFPDAV